MTRARLLVIPVVALALWAGYRSYPSTSLRTEFETVLAVVMAANLVFCLWIWSRAKPGSGDAIAMRFMSLFMAAMLINLVPKLVWPQFEGLQIAGSVVSAVTITVLVVMLIRRRRKATRPAE